MGLLRLLTNPVVMGRGPGIVAQPWQVYGEFRDDRRVVFAIERNGVECVWRELMTRSGVGPSS
jgi:hypothetical protein